jgi:hypothetical protein
MVEPKIEFLIPIKTNLLFIVFENKDAKFYETTEMRFVHKLHFETSYKVPMSKPTSPRHKKISRKNSDESVDLS